MDDCDPEPLHNTEIVEDSACFSAFFSSIMGVEGRNEVAGLLSLLFFGNVFKELFWKMMVRLFLLFALHCQNIVLLYEVIDVVCGDIVKTLVCYDDCRKNPNYMVTYL